MKHMQNLSARLALAGAGLVLVACQATAQLFATPTPTASSTPSPTSTRTPTPTRTPTLTPTPGPDASGAIVLLKDLPPGFEQLSLEELNVSIEDFKTESFQPDNVFIFINPTHFQMIFGFNFLLSRSFDRISFDAGMSQPEILLPAVVSGIGTENVRNEKLLNGFDDIGELRAAMTMVAEQQGIPMRVDLLMFRRDILGALVMSMVIEGQKPNVSLHDVGSKLDERMIEVVQDWE